MRDEGGDGMEGRKAGKGAAHPFQRKWASAAKKLLSHHLT
jgi:hypothetical protein